MSKSPTNSFGPPTPVFRVKDVDASIVYYLNALGFELQWRAGAGFACVAREQCSIFLTDDNQSQPRMWVWIGVEDVRELHDEYVKSGGKIRNPPNNFEWALEMQVEDLDGNVLRIGSDPEKEKPLGVWRDADGIGWRHLGNLKIRARRLRTSLRTSRAAFPAVAPLHPVSQAFYRRRNVPVGIRPSDVCKNWIRARTQFRSPLPDEWRTRRRLRIGSC